MIGVVDDVLDVVMSDDVWLGWSGTVGDGVANFARTSTTRLRCRDEERKCFKLSRNCEGGLRFVCLCCM